MTPTEAFLNALFEIGDDIQRIDWDGDFFSLAPSAQVSLLIKDVIANWGPERGGTALLAAFGKWKSPAFCANVWLARGRELGEIPFEETSRRDNLISVETFKALGVQLLTMIEAGAASGSLNAAPFYYAIAHAWSYLAGDEAVRAWISHGASTSANFLAKLALGFLAYTQKPSGREYIFQDSALKPYYALDVISEACARHASAEGLSQDEAARIRVLKVGLDELKDRENTTKQSSAEQGS